MIKRITIPILAIAVAATTISSCATRNASFRNVSSTLMSAASVFSSQELSVSCITPSSSEVSSSYVSKASSIPKVTSKTDEKISSKAKTFSKTAKSKKGGSSTPSQTPSAPKSSTPSNTAMPKADLISIYKAAENKSNDLSQAEYSINDSLESKDNIYYTEKQNSNIKQNGKTILINQNGSYYDIDNTLNTYYQSIYYDGKTQYVKYEDGPAETMDGNPMDNIYYIKNLDLNEDDITINDVQDNGTCYILDFTTKRTDAFQNIFESYCIDYSKSKISSAEILATINKSTGYLVSKTIKVNLDGYVDADECFDAHWENNISFTEVVTYSNPGDSVTIAKPDYAK